MSLLEITWSGVLRYVAGLAEKIDEYECNLHDVDSLIRGFADAEGRSGLDVGEDLVAASLAADRGDP